MASRAEMRMASAIIVLVLGGQLFADVFMSNKWTWPFTDYPMYAGSHREGERIPYHVVFGTTDTGEEIEITANDLGNVGFNVWLFLDWTKGIVAAANRPADTPVVRTRLERPLRGWLKSTGVTAWFKGDDAGPKIPMDLPLRLYEQEYGKKIVRLRIEDVGIIVTRQGMQQVPRAVLAEVDVPAHAE